MKKQLAKLATAAAFGLALVLTFSCSSEDGGETPSSETANSSSSGSSSSSANLPVYPASSSSSDGSSSSIGNSSSSSGDISSSSSSSSSSLTVSSSSSSSSSATLEELILCVEAVIMTMDLNSAIAACNITDEGIIFVLQQLFSSSSSSIGLPSSSSSAGSNGNGTYESVTIGTQIWMKKNLNVDVEGSKCYDNESANCEKYGRLYNWATAMALPSSCNRSTCASQINAKHQGICPSGWHIPSGSDWQTLMNYVDGTSYTIPQSSSTAGKKLKATDGWNSNGNGQDTYGFAALPGGYGFLGSYFTDAGLNGYWWSATENEASSASAYSRYMHYGSEIAGLGGYDMSYLQSVRCVKD